MHFIVELSANDLGQEILLNVTNPTIVSFIKIVGLVQASVNLYNQIENWHRQKAKEETASKDFKCTYDSLHYFAS